MTTNRSVEGAAVPVESVLARHTVARAAYVGPVLVLVAALARGSDGAVAAAIGVALVVGNFLLAGAMSSLAIRISLAMYHAAALFGFVLRLGLVAGTMLVVVAVAEIDRVAFGITAVATYMVLLVLEAVSVARGRERELDWTR